MAKLFGFQIDGTGEAPKNSKVVSPIPKNDEDKSDYFITSGFYGQYVDIEGVYKNEADLVRRYREMALHPECDSAIEDIVNEAIVSDLNDSPVQIDLTNLPASDKLKDIIRKEFKHLKEIMDFDKKAHEIFRNWYTDGRLYYHKVIDLNHPEDGIKELRYIDPLKIKLIRKLKKKQEGTLAAQMRSIMSNQNYNEEMINPEIEEYYVYDPNVGYSPTTSNLHSADKAIKLTKDSITYVTSGLVDRNRQSILSYLHKAIKALNQLRMIEDSIVIYRLSRASEKRLFYIDVGNLPKIKAEQYMRDVMNRYRNKLVYDACLSMNTKVPLLDGRTLTLTQITEEFNKGERLWAYSCDPNTGKFAPGVISWAGVTRKNEKVMRITLDNDETITCTLDHKFPVWNKGKIEAKDLQIGESMIRFYGKNDSVNLTNKNHKIKNIEFLDETIDVGTLTIDREELYHDYHTFALDAGIYTCNSTGEVRDDRKFMSMLEDFWLPRREGGRGTEITTLPGGQNLGELTDIEYFQKKLYRSLGVPETRIAGGGDGFNLGRSSEILRDELMFSKFVGRLRKRFSNLFNDILRTQLILKNIVSPEDWDRMSDHIQYDFLYDNHFAELKEAELLTNRLTLATTVEPYIGKYYSTEYVRKKILRQTDSEIIEIDMQIEDEIAKGILPNPNAPVDENGNPLPPEQGQDIQQGASGEVPMEPSIDTSTLEIPAPKGGKI